MAEDPADILPDTVDAILEAAIADGMATDLSELSFKFDAKGNVAIEAKPADGSAPYTNDMSADEIAAALGMDVTEDATETEAPKAPAKAPDAPAAAGGKAAAQ